MLFALLSIPVLYFSLRKRFEGFELFWAIEIGFYVVLVIYLLWKGGFLL